MIRLTVAAAVALALAGCGGSRPAGPSRPPFSAPVATGGVLVKPHGPVGALLRHLPPGVDAITAVDLKVARAELGVRADADPYLPGPREVPAAAATLASIAGLIVPPPDAGALLGGVDFGSVRAIVEFAGPGTRGVLLRTAVRPAVRGGRLRLIRGGIVLGSSRAVAAAAAGRRAIPRDDRALVALLGSYPSAASFAYRPSGSRCVISVVAMETLAPPAASVTVTVRGVPSRSRLALPSVARAGLVLGMPVISGASINVPVLPRRRGAAGRVALRAIIGALERGPVYRCG
ncbi:MAG TPA: hypothetical protein VG223_09510 [Solirubrobacteraceae bacterium]|nr:hypothetical protein [Solirubrobacteraceae bacterium]